LLILDNLETLSTESLSELLTVAKQWSEIGQCRVLLTTRTPDFHHPDYPTEGSFIHQALPLSGLAPDDALAYFQRLLKLPPPPKLDLPKREVVLDIFKQVSFHPLSIGLIARQLKIRRPAELGMRLEKLMAQTPDNPLLASLNLSLDKLDEAAQAWLPRLGVFQDGAFEDDLLQINEFTEEQWQTLRQALETTGLIQPERLPGVTVPYLKFHPTLAPTLWTRLCAEEQTELLARHRQRYYELSGYLSRESNKNPHEAHAIFLRELSNLLFAVHGALDVGEGYAMDFVRRVNWFLKVFGLNRDRAILSQRVEKMDGYLASINVGEQLFIADRYQEAAQVFSKVLTDLGEQASYEHITILDWLGNCLREQGKAAQAVKYYRQGLAIAEQLGQSIEMSALQGNLAEALIDIGDYDEAKKACESALTIARKQDDYRQIASIEGHLGTLAMQQGNLQEAAQRYGEVLAIFHQLNEPDSEAAYYHKLGSVYLNAAEWKAAEHAYREAARLYESQGNLAAIAETWGDLATVNQLAGNPEEAEVWYRKVLNANKQSDNNKQRAIDLNNFANLLANNYPNRLQEAQKLAEEALALRQNLDSGAAEIWKSYDLLARIVEKQNDIAKASEYRRLSREARAAFAGTRYELRKYGQLIATVVAAVHQGAIRIEIEGKEAKNVWENLMAAIQRILDGERDKDMLCESLSLTESMIIYAILRGIENPETLKELLED